MSDRDAAAPQTLEEKLARHVSVGGRARATLEQLERQWATVAVNGHTALVASMGKLQEWKWISGSGARSLWELT